MRAAGHPAGCAEDQWVMHYQEHRRQESLHFGRRRVTKFPMQHNNAPANHFRDLPPLQAALLEFVAEHGTANTMPTQAQLKVHGRSDLSDAITRYHGGMAAVAGRLGLEMAQDHLPDQHWTDLKAIAS